jgi:hypothetical protein
MKSGSNVRPLSDFFNDELLKAYFVTRIFDFNAENIISIAKRMGRTNTARLLRGYLDNAATSVVQLPWLTHVSAACEFMEKQGTHRKFPAPTDACQHLYTRQDTWMVSIAIAEYLGGPELLKCLDPRRQFGCSDNHPTVRRMMDYWYACKRFCTPYRGRPRRHETVFDWTLLTAAYFGDLALMKRLLAQHLEEFQCKRPIPPAVLVATRRRSAEVLKILFDVLPDAQEPRPRPAPFWGDCDPDRSNYDQWQRIFRGKYLRRARKVLSAHDKQDASSASSSGISQIHVARKNDIHDAAMLPSDNEEDFEW